MSLLPRLIVQGLRNRRTADGTPASRKAPSRPLEQRRSNGGGMDVATAAYGSPEFAPITIAISGVTDQNTSADHPSGKNAY
jgi:hypothetical protein